MNIVRGKREHAEAERADGMGGGTPGRRSVLGGLAALPVLYSVTSATPAVSASAARPGSVPTAAGDLMRGVERQYNAPLLTPETRLLLPAGVKAVPVLDYYHHPHLASVASAWPYMKAADGTTVDASVIPERGAPTRIAILSALTEGWYELIHANGRADRVMWDAGKLPVLWVYGEFGATNESPYHDRFYALALQPMSRNPYPAAPPFTRRRMSHHFDYPQDERLDITDAYCFAEARDDFGPRTVFGMNASPSTGKPWNPAGYYELKLDTNEDYVEDITWRFTFPVDSTGKQHVQVAELTGKEATDRNAKGRIITPPNAPVGEVLEVERGIKIFAGKRRDPFFNFIPFPVAVAKALADGTFPDLAGLFPPHDSFLNNSVRSVLVEAPVEVTGFRLLNYWASTAIYDQGHSTWVQLQRAGGPKTTTFWDFEMGSAKTNINYFPYVSPPPTS